MYILVKQSNVAFVKYPPYLPNNNKTRQQCRVRASSACRLVPPGERLSTCRNHPTILDSKPRTPSSLVLRPALQFHPGRKRRAIKRFSSSISHPTQHQQRECRHKSPINQLKEISRSVPFLLCVCFLSGTISFVWCCLLKANRTRNDPASVFVVRTTTYLPTLCGW